MLGNSLVELIYDFVLNLNREAKKEGKLRWREARIDSVSGACNHSLRGSEGESRSLCVSGIWIGFVFRRDPAPRTESKRQWRYGPELSRQESSETETSGTDYTDATRTDDPYRGSTSHGKNRRLMRALLQSLSGEPSADRTYCYEGKQPQWSRASKERKASPTDTEPGWGPPSNPSAEPSEAVTTFRRDRTRFAPPYLGAKKESLAVPTVVSSASKAAVTSNGISPVPENQIGRKDPEDSFEAAMTRLTDLS
ncbi:hypothetical protein L1987_89027 [Smallanthus sonchifolius]|nr:hypothetical protein L1987_89027 [Smallanthus sonchifolius]